MSMAEFEKNRTTYSNGREAFIRRQDENFAVFKQRDSRLIKTLDELRQELRKPSDNAIKPDVSAFIFFVTQNNDPAVIAGIVDVKEEYPQLPDGKSSEVGTIQFRGIGICVDNGSLTRVVLKGDKWEVVDGQEDGVAGLPDDINTLRQMTQIAKPSMPFEYHKNTATGYLQPTADKEYEVKCMF